MLPAHTHWVNNPPCKSPPMALVKGGWKRAGSRSKHWRAKMKSKYLFLITILTFGALAVQGATTSGAGGATTTPTRPGTARQPTPGNGVNGGTANGTGTSSTTTSSTGNNSVNNNSTTTTTINGQNAQNTQTGADQSQTTANPNVTTSGGGSNQVFAVSNEVDVSFSTNGFSLLTNQTGLTPTGFTNQFSSTNTFTGSNTTTMQDQAFSQADQNLLVQVRTTVTTQLSPAAQGNVHFIIRNTVVTLVGQVPTTTDQQQASVLARGVPGVSTVLNRLAVNPLLETNMSARAALVLSNRFGTNFSPTGFLTNRVFPNGRQMLDRREQLLGRDTNTTTAP